MATNPDELYEGILDRLMDAVPSDVDKREGSIIYNALVPVALELQQIYEELEDVLTNTFADTAELDYLILRANERGIEWLEATNAVVTAQLVFASDVEEEPDIIGSVFALEDSSLMYEVTEKVSYSSYTGVYKLTCTDEGTVGNVASGDLLIEEAEDDALFESLESASITGIDTAARNDEDVEVFRQRYFDSINNEAFGGNVADYREKALEQDAIAAVQVVPVWNGAGTVKLRFLNASYGVPSASEVTAIQTAFDPSPQASGYGLAPIGHTVTVVGATPVQMAIVATLTIASGHTWNDLYDSMVQQCETYFLSLRKEWQDAAVTVSPGVLAYLIKQNISDISTFSCTINGNSADFVLDSDKVPVFSSLTEAE